MKTLTGEKMIGYAVAGGILLLLADISPKVAVGTTGLMLFAAALSHTNEIKTLAGWIARATGTPGSPVGGKVQ